MSSFTVNPQRDFSPLKMNELMAVNWGCSAICVSAAPWNMWSSLIFIGGSVPAGLLHLDEAALERDGLGEVACRCPGALRPAEVSRARLALLLVRLPEGADRLLA